MQEECGDEGQQCKWHAESEGRTEMTLRPREACALTPANLMPDRVDETGVEHYVVDSVMRKHDAMAFRRDQISEKKIVCAILPEHAKAPDFPDASSAHGHGRAEGKLHALQHIGDKNACCHL